MKPGMKIWIILVSIVLFWIGVFCFVCCADNLDDRAANMAEKALRASVHNPESIRILAVSKPDSVFGHTYITQEEKMALSMAGKSSVSCPLKPSDSAPLKHSTMPP